MDNLDRYLDQINKINAIFSKDAIARPTTADECKPLFDRLTGDLSPENLCCDGELSGAAVRKKAKVLNGAWGNLEAIFGRCVNDNEVYGWELWKHSGPFGA